MCSRHAGVVVRDAVEATREGAGRLERTVQVPAPVVGLRPPYRSGELPPAVPIPTTCTGDPGTRPTYTV